MIIIVRNEVLNEIKHIRVVMLIQKNKILDKNINILIREIETKSH